MDIFRATREAENNMVRRDIAIAEKFGGHLHIAHISTKESVKLVEKAKKSNLTFTVGGSVSKKTIEKINTNFSDLKEIVSKLETRKVMLPTKVFVEKEMRSFGQKIF